MPLAMRTLGDVLLHIYDFPFWGAIYVQDVVRYEADTPCFVGGCGSEEDESVFHRTCLHYGFKHWFNVAVVSDTCDDVSPKTEQGLIAAFNDDCREGGWLQRMMNYRKPEKEDGIGSS